MLLASDRGQHDHDKSGHVRLEVQMLAGNRSSSSDLQETFRALSSIRRSRMVVFM
jgi:hypothetical protein